VGYCISTKHELEVRCVTCRQITSNGEVSVLLTPTSDSTLHTLAGRVVKVDVHVVSTTFDFCLYSISVDDDLVVRFELGLVWFGLGTHTVYRYLAHR
jgi:hypothetical protein